MSSDSFGCFFLIFCFNWWRMCSIWFRDQSLGYWCQIRRSVDGHHKHGGNDSRHCLAVRCWIIDKQEGGDLCNYFITFFTRLRSYLSFCALFPSLGMNFRFSATTSIFAIAISGSIYRNGTEDTIIEMAQKIPCMLIHLCCILVSTTVNSNSLHKLTERH